MMEMAHREKFAEIIFENIRDGIVMLDREYKILALNNSVQKWMDKSINELIKKDCREVFNDVKGVCPHCTAKVTLETGEVKIEVQKVYINDNINYAELSAYPVKDEAGYIIGCIVFIQDATERMLCQNEITQTKEYLEGFIENSADAIVASDLDGIVTAWNKGAEKIYGFTKEDTIGKFLPFVPEFLIDPEREMVDRIREGAVLKDIETVRVKKDGVIITVSVTLSPIKDSAGKVIGVSCISRDISEKKRVEKELVRRSQELSRLFFISSAMRGTLELDRLLRMVLTAVTMSDGLGFNRAILFLVDEKKGVLKGAMGVGPADPEEAGKIWERLSIEKKTLSDIMLEIEKGPLRKDSFFDRLSLGIEIPLNEETILSRAVKEKRYFYVPDVKVETQSDAVLTQQLGTQAYAVVPLISRDKVIGVLWADNYFNMKPIVGEDMRFLTAFANHVATAVESARLYEKVALAEQELENIFGSISDMIYFIGKDYVIRNVNKAVCIRLEKRPEDIIGKKCYEVFHGMHEPWTQCPHQKSIEDKKAYIQEVEDPYLGGIFITSSSPIFNMAGEFIGTVNVLRDITDLKHLQERLVTTEKMAALGEVAAKVAHEIRNPLVSIGGFARRLEKKLDGTLKEYVDIIAREVERLESILNEILSFVKEMRIVKEKVTAKELIEEVISLVRSDIEERGVTIVRDIEDPIELYVDPNRIKEALLNIMSNAVQSMDGSGTTFIKAYIRNDTAIIEIKDTGSGIKEEDMHFIFNPFFTTKKTGTGLGLAITHRIIEEHEGSIEVDSKPGLGSTFRVFLPLNK